LVHDSYFEIMERTKKTTVWFSVRYHKNAWKNQVFFVVVVVAEKQKKNTKIRIFFVELPKSFKSDCLTIIYNEKHSLQMILILSKNTLQTDLHFYRNKN
jgi:hypothetical protein